MEDIQLLITFLLILIPLGGGARIVYCLTVMAADSDEEKTYKVRIRNVLVFVALAECVAGLLKAVLSYF